MEMTITFGEDFGFWPCYLDVYFEIRDGLNQSANLVGLFCDFHNKGYVFRSSGRHMWLNLHNPDIIGDGVFHANYTARQTNLTGMKLC